MDPRGTVGRIYKEDHYTLLHTKYESSGHYGFGEEDFLKFFPWRHRGGARMDPRAQLAGFIKRNTIYCYKQWPPPPPQGGACMNPRGTVGRIYKEEHYILLQTKYESSGPCGFGEEDFFIFCHVTRISRSNFSSPYPWMLHIKFQLDRPSGFRDEDLWNCGRTTDGRRIMAIL